MTGRSADDGKKKRAESDEELILRAQAGDEVAMEAILLRYTWLVRSIVRKYYVTNGTEEDLVQEGLVGIFEAVKVYDPKKNDNFLAYLSMCVDSAVKDAIRMATRKKHSPLNDAVDLEAIGTGGDGSGTPPDYVYDPVHNYIEREGLDTFYESVGKLCPPQHVEVLRHYLEGYTYAEIASMVGISRKKVDNILTSVKQKITNNGKLFK